MTGLSARRRWLLLALVLTAGILNYIDRQIIAVLKPMISADLHWTDDDYGTLAAWFQGAAAIAFLFTGWIVDRIGVKWSNPIGVAAWSVAALLHGWAASFGQFIVVRVALGATEAMGTPNQIKTVASIFPPRLRSTGYGLGNMVGSIGAIVTPLMIPAFAVIWGWRAAFVAAGVAGIVWAGVWLLSTRGLALAAIPDDALETPGSVTRAEDEPAPAYGPILRDRRTWTIAIAKVLSDATWWLMLFWMPDFYHRHYGLDGTALGPPLAIAYTGAAIGALLAGTVSTRLLGQGWSVNRTRKVMMLASGLCVLPVSLVLSIDNYPLVVFLMALALAGHQGFSTSLFALIADVTPHDKVGRVTAFGAFCGNIGGVAISKIAGLVLMAGLGYAPLFLFASVSYLLALGCIQVLLPVIRRAPDAGAGPALAH